MFLTLKEKEKYVLKLREEGKTYRDIAHQLLISPREISRILKGANGEKEAKERIQYYQIQDFFKLAIMTILDIIKKDPKKEILINNILNPNENLESGFYLISYEEKITQIAAYTLSNITLGINTHNILNYQIYFSN